MLCHNLNDFGNFLRNRCEYCFHRETIEKIPENFIDILPKIDTVERRRKTRGIYMRKTFYVSVILRYMRIAMMGMTEKFFFVTESKNAKRL